MVQTLAPGAPPNSELFADVERDLTRVEQSLAELTHENADPEGVVAWLVSSTSAVDDADDREDGLLDVTVGHVGREGDEVTGAPAAIVT